MSNSTNNEQEQNGKPVSAAGPEGTGYDPEKELEKHTGVKMRLIDAVKGFIIGATMSVPGASGGTMAILLGIYDDIIGAVSALRRSFKKSFFFLLTLFIGGFLGLLCITKPMEYLLEHFEYPTLFFFAGAILGGVPLLCRQSRVKKFTPGVIGWPVLGAAIVIGIWALELFGLKFEYNAGGGLKDYLILFLIGLVCSAGFVLPGISTSFLFVLFGIYEEMLAAVSGFDIKFIFSLGLGMLIGAVLVAKLLDKLMTRYTQQSFLTMLGFVLGSLVAVIPGIPQGWNILWCVLTLVAGFLAIYFPSRHEN